MPRTQTLPAIAGLFGTLPIYTVFVAPADADRARAAFRALRIRPTDAGVFHINCHGVCPRGEGFEAHLFYVTLNAMSRLRDAGAVDPDRIITMGR
jgi:hypothetical protein